MDTGMLTNITALFVSISALIVSSEDYIVERLPQEHSPELAPPHQPLSAPASMVAEVVDAARRIEV